MYEKSGIFTVRSAYHLAVSIDRERENHESCSARADGSRPRFNCIWVAKVLPKVKVFAWRLSRMGWQRNRTGGSRDWRVLLRVRYAARRMKRATMRWSGALRQSC
jgi:hypothetical protein